MPKPKHPLRQLRAATPYATQAAFAAFLGVPVAAVQSVECGRARVTPRLAAHVRELTGADDVELLRGADGAALTLSGKRYTAEAFAAWQGSAAQSEDRARREALLRTWRAGWQRLAGGETDGAALRDRLIPWQSCEFASAEARDWKHQTPSRQRLSGWSPLLALPPRTRLTLAVQSVPPWNPGVAPPGMAAANAELFPPCYFTVAAGSGGCRMAAAFWQAACREHGIHAENGKPLYETPTGNWRGFFRGHAGRCEPHAVFAGLDPGEAANWPRGLFSGGGILCGRAGEEMAEATLQFIESHSADAGSPAGILLFASLEGGTASALGSLLLERLRVRFPSVPILVTGVLPVAGVSPVLSAPLHIALAMRSIRRHADAALLFSNDHLLTQAEKFWLIMAPGYAGANRLIAECLTALTAPLRFGGTDAPPADLAGIIGCFPSGIAGGIPVITGECRPLAALTDRRLRTITLPWLMQRALHGASLADKTAAGIALFLRVRLLPGGEFITTGEPSAVSITGRTIPGLHESASVFAPSPVIRRTLRRLARQAREVLATENAEASCRELGVSAEEMRAAVHEMDR